MNLETEVYIYEFYPFGQLLKKQLDWIIKDYLSNYNEREILEYKRIAFRKFYDQLFRLTGFDFLQEDFEQAYIYKLYYNYEYYPEFRRGIKKIIKVLLNTITANIVGSESAIKIELLVDGKRPKRDLKNYFSNIHNFLWAVKINYANINSALKKLNLLKELKEHEAINRARYNKEIGIERAKKLTTAFFKKNPHLENDKFIVANFKDSFLIHAIDIKASIEKYNKANPGKGTKEKEKRIKAIRYVVEDGLGQKEACEKSGESYSAFRRFKSTNKKTYDKIVDEIIQGKTDKDLLLYLK